MNTESIITMIYKSYLFILALLLSLTACKEHNILFITASKSVYTLKMLVHGVK